MCAAASLDSCHLFWLIILQTCKSDSSLSWEEHLANVWLTCQYFTDIYWAIFLNAVWSQDAHADKLVVQRWQVANDPNQLAIPRAWQSKLVSWKPEGADSIASESATMWYGQNVQCDQIEIGLWYNSYAWKCFSTLGFSSKLEGVEYRSTCERWWRFPAAFFQSAKVSQFRHLKQYRMTVLCCSLSGLSWKEPSYCNTLWSEFTPGNPKAWLIQCIATTKAW